MNMTKMTFVLVLAILTGFAASQGFGEERSYENSSPALRGSLYPVTPPAALGFLLAQAGEAPAPTAEEALGEAPVNDLVGIEDDASTNGETAPLDEITEIGIEAEEEDEEGK